MYKTCNKCNNQYPFSWFLGDKCNVCRKCRVKLGLKHKPSFISYDYIKSLSSKDIPIISPKIKEVKPKEKKLPEIKEIDKYTIAKKLYSFAKNRASKKNLQFNIDIEDIIIPDICPVLNIPINSFKNIHSPNSITLDRINSKKGYVKGNIQVISFRANNIKKDMTAKEIECLYDYYIIQKNYTI